jgi:hypothetical protein
MASDSIAPNVQRTEFAAFMVERNMNLASRVRNAMEWEPANCRERTLHCERVTQVIGCARENAALWDAAFSFYLRRVFSHLRGL